MNKSRRGTKHDMTFLGLNMFMQRQCLHNHILLVLNCDFATTDRHASALARNINWCWNSICFCWWILPISLSFFAVAFNCGISHCCASSIRAAVWLLCGVSVKISLAPVCFPSSFSRCRSPFRAANEAEPTKSRHPPPCPPLAPPFDCCVLFRR